MLKQGTKVVLDPGNSQSVRIENGESLGGRTLVCQANGDQETGVERAEDTAIIAAALNAHLDPESLSDDDLNERIRVLEEIRFTRGAVRRSNAAAPNRGT